MYKYQEKKLLEENKMYRDTQSGGSFYQEPTEGESEKHFISLMSSMSHTYGNILAFGQNYILKNLFPQNLFKTIHVNSKIAHRQIKETSHEFLKKDKPMIIFRPRIAGQDEYRFLKGTPLIERQGDIHSTWGATELQPFFEDPYRDVAVKYQQNRSVMYIDVIAIFATLFNQMDYVHYLQNATRWEHPLSVKTCLESYLPQDMLKIISDVTKVPIMDEHDSVNDFVKYISQFSNNTITYKLQGSSGTKEFYRYYLSSVDMLFSDLSWDDGERMEHVMSQYQVSFTLRLEFWSTGFYYLFSDDLFHIKLPEIDTSDSRIIPIYTDILLKEDLNLQLGWNLYNRVSCKLENPDDVVNLDQLINNSIRYVIKYYKDNALPLMEFLDIKVRRQGELIHEGKDYMIDYDTLDLKFIKQSTFLTYTILICINKDCIDTLLKKSFNLK